MEKVMFFIEGSYFYKGCKKNNLKGWYATHVDIYKFCESFLDTSKHRLIRVYYYDAPYKLQWDKKRYALQQQYHSRLKMQDYVELRLGRLQGNGPQNITEKGVDVMASVDMIRFAYNNNYDIGCIISADGDYEPAIQMCKDLGKRIWNVHFSNLTAHHLINICDKSVSFDDKHIMKFQITT